MQFFRHLKFFSIPGRFQFLDVLPMTLTKHRHFARAAFPKTFAAFGGMRANSSFICLFILLIQVNHEVGKKWRRQKTF